VDRLFWNCCSKKQEVAGLFQRDESGFPILTSSVSPQRRQSTGGVVTLDLPAPARLAILCDIAEENWPSMDLVGDMLFEGLQRDHAESITATRLVPPMRRRFTRVASGSGHFFNADRLINRFWDYQSWLRSRTQEFDLFHVIDHSYGQLLHHLPPERTIVTCHDLDTFRSLLYPEAEPRSRLFKKMMSYVLSGFQKAALVACDSEATRDELLAHELIAPERLRVVPLGVHPSCSPEPNPAADSEARRYLGEGPGNAINLLHVGSTIKRKRIDVLLETLAGARKEFPQMRLLRVGGPFTPVQVDQARRLDVENAIVVLPHLAREVLAAVYRQSDLVLQPSDAEGFGLPVIEAMACGAPVIASDLPVLREVGGEAASYAPVSEVPAWIEAISHLLHEREQQPEKWTARKAAGITQAAKFSWAEYARKMVGLYDEVLQG
jgi:glycosyltransferase involved in cell wall biosynthesis